MYQLKGNAVTPYVLAHPDINKKTEHTGGLSFGSSAILVL